MKILVTGGAGFIGTHFVRHALYKGSELAILDNFSPQIHGHNNSLPRDIAPHVRLVRADVRDADAVANAIEGAEGVVHLAAETGTGQSMYAVRRYEDVNIGGTAVLFDYLMNNRASCIKRVVVASSRAVCGEGAYVCQVHQLVYPTRRRTDHMKAGQYEPLCPYCSQACSPCATPEEAPFSPSSFYGLTKQAQEQMTLLLASSIGISGIALRYQNVYGPGQSLSNPYTGILAIFSNLARSEERICIFEDGEESRDFVYVDDVVDATWRAVTADRIGTAVFNVGSGQRTTVLQVADEIVRFYGSRSAVSVTGAFREGDIRHNCARITMAQEKLGFAPKWDFRKGLTKFLEWANSQTVPPVGYQDSLAEMRERGLLHG